MDSSSEDDFVIALLISEDEEVSKKKKRKKAMWIHDICKRRHSDSEYNTLFENLQRDETKFFQYFRMSCQKFYELLDILRPELLRQNTRFRRAIPPEERLAVCLR